MFFNIAMWGSDIATTKAGTKLDILGPLVGSFINWLVGGYLWTKEGYRIQIW